MIYEFDHEETLQEIKENFLKIIDLSNSLADNTSKYREFYTEVGLEFSVAKEAIKKAEYSLLIDCYTYSERLLKNTIYHCLEFKSNNNRHINNFISKKLDPEKFSPSPKFKDFEVELNSLNSGFKFLLNVNFSKVEIYNSMINSRHRYAHSNVYPVDIRESKNDLLEILEYLGWECNMFLNHFERHCELESLFKCIISDSQKLKKIQSGKIIRNLTEQESYKINIKDFRTNVRLFNRKYLENLSDVSVFKSVLVEFEKIENLNFNINKGKELAKVCIDLNNCLR
ncbi:hypothetical protein [Vagococcus lutrae]|uniref:RiboL-PSP-HEPN domain-containing protein n=1 Tax=Vagococcus lutrae LBD1 TaxID=1408226 RepID=V6Q643_9ENTE|nr:hypothetical protein [Vagococcus lutrae]EST90242.1 hypothetical protein T233_00808 [Vagococcus lutrae LBD1]NKZ27699.1 hypothetical protein [Vagococcus lutrae]